MADNLREGFREPVALPVAVVIAVMCCSRKSSLSLKTSLWRAVVFLRTRATISRVRVALMSVQNHEGCLRSGGGGGRTTVLLTRCENGIAVGLVLRSTATPLTVDEADTLLDESKAALSSVDGGRDDAKVDIVAAESVLGRSPARGHWPWRVGPSLPCTMSTSPAG